MSIDARLIGTQPKPPAKNCRRKHSWRVDGVFLRCVRCPRVLDGLDTPRYILDSITANNLSAEDAREWREAILSEAVHRVKETPVPPPPRSEQPAPVPLTGSPWARRRKGLTS